MFMGVLKNALRMHIRVYAHAHYRLFACAMCLQSGSLIMNPGPY